MVLAPVALHFPRPALGAVDLWVERGGRAFVPPRAPFDPRNPQCCHHESAQSCHSPGPTASVLRVFSCVVVPRGWEGWAQL